MSREPEVRSLLAPMSEREVDLDGAGFRVDREQVLARMAQAGRAPERRASRRLGYWALAAAGILSLVLGARFLTREGASSPQTASLEVLVSEGAATQVSGTTHAGVVANQRSQIAAAGELETAADSKAQVSTADGLQIELSAQTRVGLADLQPKNSALKLLGGAVRCSVPHRTAGHAFQVVTPDVTVVDLGTVFTVSVDGVNHSTRVSVEEGQVMVRHASGQTLVRAPNSWSSAALVAQPTAAVAPSDPAPSASDTPPSPSAKLPPKPAHGDAPPATTLAQEAQLLRQGLAAERQGRSAEAISALSLLLRKYPRSPLVPDARAALARVEARPAQ